MSKNGRETPPPRAEILTRPVGLSRRLAAIVDLAGSGECVCDVGCDHAHVPIRLLQEGRFRRAVGMDVIAGPLEKAAGNVALYGMEDRIELRLSDGLDACIPCEADTLVVTGMGGTLMEEILLREPDKTRSFQALVLGPQSDPDKVRAALRRLGGQILEEQLIYEDGKYYPVIRAVFAQAPEGDKASVPIGLPSARDTNADGTRDETRYGSAEGSAGRACSGAAAAESAGAAFDPQIPIPVRRAAEDLFGPVLLSRRDAVLREYLQRQTAVLEKILDSVSRAAEQERAPGDARDRALREKHLAKKEEIRRSLEIFRAALTVYRDP